MSHCYYANRKKVNGSSIAPWNRNNLFSKTYKGTTSSVSQFQHGKCKQSHPNDMKQWSGKHGFNFNHVYSDLRRPQYTGDIYKQGKIHEFIAKDVHTYPHRLQHYEKTYSRIAYRNKHVRYVNKEQGRQLCPRYANNRSYSQRSCYCVYKDDNNTHSRPQHRKYAHIGDKIHRFNAKQTASDSHMLQHHNYSTCQHGRYFNNNQGKQSYHRFANQQSNLQKFSDKHSKCDLKRPQYQKYANTVSEIHENSTNHVYSDPTTQKLSNQGESLHNRAQINNINNPSSFIEITSEEFNSIFPTTKSTVKLGQNSENKAQNGNNCVENAYITDTLKGISPQSENKSANLRNSENNLVIMSNPENFNTQTDNCAKQHDSLANTLEINPACTQLNTGSRNNNQESKVQSGQNTGRQNDSQAGDKLQNSLHSTACFEKGCSNTNTGNLNKIQTSENCPTSKTTSQKNQQTSEIASNAHCKQCDNNIDFKDDSTCSCNTNMTSNTENDSHVDETLNSTCPEHQLKHKKQTGEHITYTSGRVKNSSPQKFDKKHDLRQKLDGSIRGQHFEKLHSNGDNRQPLGKDPNKTSRITNTNTEKQSYIQLSPKNIVNGVLPDKTKMVILADSGSNLNMISQAFIETSPYLSSLEQNDIPETSFLVAGGGKMLINKTIDFAVCIQNQHFILQAHVMPRCGAISLLLGTQTLADLQGTLDFTNHTLTVKQKKIQVHPTKDYTLKPGVKTTIELFTHLPKMLINSPLVVNFNDFVSNLTLPSVFLNFKRGRTQIIAVNTSNRPVKILKSKSVGHIDIPASFSLMIPASVATLEKQADNIYTDLRTDKTCDNITYRVEQQQSVDRVKLKEEKMKLYKHLDHDDPKLSMTDREILDNEVNFDPQETVLDPDEILELREFLFDKKQVFSLHGEIGDTGYEVKLEIKDPSPCFIRPYSVSEADKIHIDKYLNKMVILGILRPGMATCTFPIMLIPKKGQSTPRMVSDLRQLNKRLHNLSYPFPLVRDTLQTIGAAGSTVFTLIDIKEAFHSLRLHEDSQRYVAVSGYHGRSFRYSRLPMGSKQSSQQFQMYMDTILTELPGASKYVQAHSDDLLIHSPNKSLHRLHVENVINLLIKHGLKISPKKAKFFRHTLLYMGHIVTVKNKQPHVTILKSRIDAIQRMKQPTNVRETRGLIGAINYLSMFLPNLANLLKPMYDLTRKNLKKFEWTIKHQENFEKIKALIQQSPVLATPRSTGVYTIEVDSSRIATGGALYQMQDGENRLLAYFSKTLPRAAVNYSVTELELCGLYLAIESFSNLLKGNHFQAIVDHSSLVQILKGKLEPSSMRLKKLIEKLGRYSFQIGYKSGKNLRLVDFLSRHIEPESSDDILRKMKVDSDYNIDQILMKNIEKCVNSPISLSTTQEQTNDQNAENNHQEVISKTDNTLHEYVCTGKQTGEMTEQHRYMTRSKAKQHDSKLPTSFDKDRRTHDTAVRETLDTSANQTDNTRHTGIQQTGSQQAPTLDIYDNPLATEEHYQPIPTKDLQLERTSLTKLKDSEKTTTQQKVTLELTKQRLESDKNKQSDEVIYTDPPDYMYRPDKPIIDTLSTDDIVLKHYPKQADISRILQSVAHRCVTDFSLPLSHTELKIHQQKDPFFKRIYNFLSCGMLPSDSRQAKTVKKQGNNYLLANNLLFKIDFTEDGKSFKLTLCIPEALVPVIIEKHHSTLYSSHQGIQRTFLKIRQNYYCHKLFEKLRAYISSCIRCQTRKSESPTAKERQMVPRIFHDYVPFSEIHIDVKYLFRSNDFFNYLLVCVCPLTRYVICVPIRNQDCITIAEAILQRIVFVYGKPNRIVSDEHPSNASKILLHIYKTLGIDPVYCSPTNHQSLCVERTIQSVSRLLLSHLENTGRDWTAYIPAVTYSYNSFPIPSLGGYSPYELVFCRRPPEMLGLSLFPLPSIPTTYKQYLTTLQNKFDKMGKIVLDLQKQKQLSQVQEQEQKVSESGKFVPGQLVYFFCPSAGDLQTNSLKFVSKYIGPLCISTMVDSNHAILMDLKNRQLLGTHSTKRLKAAFIRTPLGIASTLDQFKKGYGLSGNNQVKSVTNLQLVDEQGKVLNKFEDKHCLFLTEETEHNSDLTIDQEYVNMVHKYSLQNKGIALPKQLSDRQLHGIIKHIAKLPEEGTLLKVTKSRFKDGHLELLLTSDNYHLWFSLYMHPYLWKESNKIIDLIMDPKSRIRPVGSPSKMFT